MDSKKTVKTLINIMTKQGTLNKKWFCSVIGGYVGVNIDTMTSLDALNIWCGIDHG